MNRYASLEEARMYEKKAAASVSPFQRPVYHFTAPVGWLNDPNGLSYYKERYHLFFQYYPYASQWNYIHWGHAASDDLLHWEYLPAALAPDREYDRNGCFSGSAVELEDGRQLLMYTSVRKEEHPRHVFREVQTQSVAVGDGINYEKAAENPVIDYRMLPDGASRFDFRDPFIVKRPGGGYYCFLAGRDAKADGQVLVYESDDGIHWNYVKILIQNHGRFGLMWECPNFFPLDGKQVLIVSVMNMLPDGAEFHNGNNVVCLIGDLDERSMTFTETDSMQVDHGIDFYAPQTLQTPDGRSVMIGWMQNVDSFAIREADAPWAGQMSVPRELSMRGGRLYQWPVRELEGCRRNEIALKDVIIAGTEGAACEFEGINGRVVDVLLRIRPAADEMYRAFEMRFAQNDSFFTCLRILPEQGILEVDRTYSGSRRALLHKAQCRIDTDLTDLHLRILLDRYSAEVFIEEGRKVISMTMYTEESADRISFRSEGAVKMDVIKYDLNV